MFYIILITIGGSYNGNWTKTKTNTCEMGFYSRTGCRKVIISRQTVSNWENEKSLPDVASVIKMSDL